MSLYFARRKRIFPFVTLNISGGPKGLSRSYTIGIPGLSINLGKRGIFLNLGIPGTGLRYRKQLKGKKK